MGNRCFSYRILLSGLKSVNSGSRHAQFSKGSLHRKSRGLRYDQKDNGRAMPPVKDQGRQRPVVRRWAMVVKEKGESLSSNAEVTR